MRIVVEDARRRGAEIILDHLVAQWTVRHAEWMQNFFAKGDVGSSGGGTKKKVHMKHTPETKRRVMSLDSWNEFLLVAKSTMTNSPDFWSVGQLVSGTLTSSVSWKTDVCVTEVRGNRVPKDVMMQTSMNFRVRSQRKTRNQWCKAAWLTHDRLSTNNSSLR